MFAARRGHDPEIKEYYASGNNVQLYHDGSNGVTAGGFNNPFSPLTGLPQGTGNGQRIGDDIYATDCSIRLWLSNKPDRPNVMYRVAVVILPGSSALIAPNVATLFPNAGTQFITAFNDTAQYSVLYDKIVNKDTYSTVWYAGASIAKERSFFHDVHLPFKAPVTFNGTNTATASLYVYVIAYDAFGSLAADNIASYAYSTRLRYTDK
jgi:hypothetical protein